MGICWLLLVSDSHLKNMRNFAKIQVNVRSNNVNNSYGSILLQITVIKTDGKKQFVQSVVKFLDRHVSIQGQDSCGKQIFDVTVSRCIHFNSHRQKALRACKLSNNIMQMMKHQTQFKTLLRHLYPLWR